MIYILIIQGLIFGAFSAYVAKEKNKGPLTWFILGFFFSILAILALAATPKKENKYLSEENPIPNADRKHDDQEGEISDKSYQMYLVSKYGITRNEVLNVYGLDGSAYENIDEPLLIAHQKHSADVAEKNQPNRLNTPREDNLFGHKCTVYPDGSASIATAAGKVHTFKTKEEARIFAKNTPPAN